MIRKFNSKAQNPGVVAVVGAAGSIDSRLWNPMNRVPSTDRLVLVFRYPKGEVEPNAFLASYFHPKENEPDQQGHWRLHDRDERAEWLIKDLFALWIDLPDPPAVSQIQNMHYPTNWEDEQKIRRVYGASDPKMNAEPRGRFEANG